MKAPAFCVNILLLPMKNKRQTENMAKQKIVFGEYMLDALPRLSVPAGWDMKSFRQKETEGFYA